MAQESRQVESRPDQAHHQGALCRVPGGQHKAHLGALQGKDPGRDTSQQCSLSGLPLGWAPWFPECAFSFSWELSSGQELQPRLPVPQGEKPS